MYEVSRSENSVLNCCVCKAERTSEVVNLFCSYDWPVGSYVDSSCILAKFVWDCDVSNC